VMISSPVASPATVAVAGGAKSKRQTGYHVFVKARNQELKGVVTDASDRQKQIVAEWKAFSEPQKAGYKTQAAGAVQAVVVGTNMVQPTKTKSLTGYQHFMSAKMAALKAAGHAPSTCMSLGAKAWKVLSDPEKKEWTSRAQTFLANGSKKEDIPVLDASVPETLVQVKADELAELVVDPESEPAHTKMDTVAKPAIKVTAKAVPVSA